MIHQRIIADPERGDGHDAEGNPGDCMRAAIASRLGERYEDVPHFAQHVGWWDYMRRWARARGGDFTCVIPENGSIRHAFADPSTSLVGLGCGPSPRGPFWHVVLVDEDLSLVHDPHPSGAGVLEVHEVLAYCEPYDPPPGQLLLTAGA